MPSRRAFSWACAVFATIFLASACYTLTRTKLYEGVASSSELLPPASSYEDLAAYAKGAEMLGRVAARITGADLDRMLSAYASPPGRTPELLAEVLTANRAVELKSPQGPIVIAYRHPDPVLAARLANMFIDELIQWSSRMRIDRMIARVEDLALEREIIANEVEQLNQTLSAAPETIRAEIAQKLATAQQALADADHRLKQTNLIPSWELSSVRRATTAKPPTSHVYPSHVMHLSIGLASGLLAGVLTLLLMSPIRFISPR